MRVCEISLAICLFFIAIHMFLEIVFKTRRENWIYGEWKNFIILRKIFAILRRFLFSSRFGLIKFWNSNWKLIVFDTKCKSHSNWIPMSTRLQNLLNRRIKLNFGYSFPFQRRQQFYVECKVISAFKCFSKFCFCLFIYV